MKHFLRIAGGIDATPALNAIAAHPELWNENTLRTAHPGTAHAAVSDIWVWFNDLAAGPEAVVDDRDVIPYRAWGIIPQLRPLIFDLMRRIEAVRLGRVIITRLAPGAEITPHVDGGAPATWYARYQIALRSLPGCLFHCGGETVSFASGDCWWFDNTREHAVVNNSADDRIVIIVDARLA